MFRRSHSLSTLTWLAGAMVGAACSIPDYGARQKPEGEGGEDPGIGGVSGVSTNGGVTSAGNGTMGGSAGNSTRGGTAGDSGASSGGDGTGGAGDGGESGSNGGNAGSGAAGKGGAGNGGAAGKGGAGNGGSGNTGGAGSGGAGNGGSSGKGGSSGGGSGGSSGKGGSAGGGSAGKGGGAGAGSGGSGGSAGKGGSAGAGNGGSGGSGPLCFTPNVNNRVVNAGFDSSSVTHFVSFDSFITLSHSTLDATGCASSGSLVVTNSHPDGLNSGAIYCLTTISPGTTYNVGGWMMEPSGFAQGQMVLQFLFTDGPDCSGSFVGDTTSIEGVSAFNTWTSVRRDGLVAPTGAVSFGVHVKTIKNFPNVLSYRAHFDMLYVTPAPGEF